MSPRDRSSEATAANEPTRLIDHHLLSLLQIVSPAHYLFVDEAIEVVAEAARRQQVIVEGNCC